ncbi:efflux RND transporter periplasmic adaptor subunit [Cochleicola gelatinilyticus]|uniref:Efflux transporter periplasmic adaptor subunit n=1 Tax=Cochleicola gelatinilyticus TaxID=1763537 RepID=A0A167IJM8_9FLAO|nr:efflux RND transporter periplasmic adaptor subunit [Cochleicola gelatinilyticus]OAB79721.1 efflux transporter periplasmic adaptor subunit [Cochleicola gelatinilyticus]
MNKNILYIAIAVTVGLAAGWLIFGSSGNDANTNKDGANTTNSHNHSDKSENQMWTCSMHPQIMQSEAGDCPICGMDLIPAESSADGLAMNEIKMTENAMALANIQTTIVGNGTMLEDDGQISLSGKIATNEENNAVQASYFDGRIERLHVNYEGQKVNRGQSLATIYAPNLVAAQQELLTTASLKESQPALYKAVRNKLKNWKLSDSQIDAIESSGNVRDNFPVYATVSGTVSEVMAHEGDYVKQGQPILKVSNLNSVWAEFDAYENQISNLNVGQKIKVVTNAYANKEFNAMVSFIDPILNNATRTVTVRATLKNTDDLFKPGMFITGKIDGELKKDIEIISVPATAVMWTGERSLVYIKTRPTEPIFEMREVTIGNRNGEIYTITDGLKNGDEIVTNGTFTVDAAAQLQGKKSMMNQGDSGDSMKPISKMELPASEREMKFSENFQNQFKMALKPYLQMKDALVMSDAKQVSTFARTTSKSLKSIEIDSLEPMVRSLIKKSIESLDIMMENGDLEKQREQFVTVNKNLIPIATKMKSMQPVLYVQKCPMANNNNGALWLSIEKEIRNPYFGDDMLTCGSVIEEVK